MNTAKPISEILPKVLTATAEPTTKGLPTYIATRQKTARERFPDFETFDDPQLELMIVEAVDFEDDARNNINPRWLSFLGHSGTGKTFLAEKIYQRLRRTSLAIHAELLTGVHKCFWPKTLSRLREGNYYIIEDLSDANLVFIDEISVEHDPSGFASDKLCELLSRRTGKWTLITSNLTLEKLADIDTRISSRMIRGNSVVVEVTTKDYALRNIVLPSPELL